MIDNRPITKRSEMIIPTCEKCGGRVDPSVAVPALPINGRPDITLVCHYGDVCRECGHISNRT